MNNMGTWNLVRVTMPVWSPLVSGLIAAFIVHLLTQSRERERWLLDSKKQEFKELLSALSESYITTVSVIRPGHGTLNQPDTRRYMDSVENLARVVRDRIFIVENLQLDEILALWSQVTECYQRQGNGAKFRDEYKLISNQIIKAATHSQPKSVIQRLRFWKS